MSPLCRLGDSVFVVVDAVEAPGEGTTGTAAIKKDFLFFTAVLLRTCGETFSSSSPISPCFSIIVSSSSPVSLDTERVSLFPGRSMNG